MSSENFIAYLGIRFEVAPEEIENLELRSDPRIVAARRQGLQYYWGYFGEQEKCLLFVGRQIGIFGTEDSGEMSLSLNDAQASFEAAASKLSEAGFSESPKFHFAWQPDI